MRRKTLSLSNELSLLMDATRGIHGLIRKWIESFGYEKEIPDTVSALLVVLIERLRLVDRAVRGDVDPRLLWSSENDAARVYIEGEDLQLTAWSDRKLARHHRAELRRAKARLESAKSKRERDQPKP